MFCLVDDGSEIVVQDEAKSPDDIELILHLVAIEAYDLLRVLQIDLYLFDLAHYIVLLSTEREAHLLIELQEVG